MHPRLDRMELKSISWLEAAARFSPGRITDPGIWTELSKGQGPGVEWSACCCEMLMTFVKAQFSSYGFLWKKLSSCCFSGFGRVGALGSWSQANAISTCPLLSTTLSLRITRLRLFLFSNDPMDPGCGVNADSSLSDWCGHLIAVWGPKPTASTASSLRGLKGQSWRPQQAEVCSWKMRKLGSVTTARWDDRAQCRMTCAETDGLEWLRTWWTCW